MSSQTKKERVTRQVRDSFAEVPVNIWLNNPKGLPPVTFPFVTGKQITVSEGHPKNLSDGSYREGGPFYTSRVTDFLKAGHLDVAEKKNAFQWNVYTGPIYGLPPTESELKSLGYKNISRSFGDKNESQMKVDGTNAISYSDPINPASDLGTGLAEIFREGVPTLPGIQSWRQRTNILRGVGSEYLNYQFGWAPLRDEVNSVTKAARQHRDLLSQYQRGEGSDTHRRFEFPIQRTVSRLPEEHPENWGGIGWFNADPAASRQVSLVRETKKWFEGCFTYGLPSSSDNWRKALGFGSDADQLFGLSLSPEILWELTPWSWAVDWFSNAGEVINNVTRFGLAGLVLRYGYMMEESIERVSADGVCPSWRCYYDPRVKTQTFSERIVHPGSYSVGTECVTKRRIPASPFGFSIGWEGLSPTQLAITAALGITRLL